MPLRITNIQAGYYDKQGFHPMRRSVDYDPERTGDDYGSRHDSAGLRYDRSSKRKRAHRFVRGAAVNPARRAAAKLIPARWSPAKVRRLKSGAVEVMIRNPLAKKRDARTGLAAGEHWYIVLQYGHQVGGSYSTRKQAQAAASKLNRQDPKSARIVHVTPRY